MSQSPLSSASPGWSLLARGEQEYDIVARCPAGHIHLDYGNLTLRFHRDEFLAFAAWIAEAAAKLSGNPVASLPESKVRVGFSKN